MRVEQVAEEAINAYEMYRDSYGFEPDAARPAVLRFLRGHLVTLDGEGGADYEAEAEAAREDGRQAPFRRAWRKYVERGK